ncbi:hypothetical protein GCM10010315_58510 [Streptomyces luteosporeus]|uniref:Uncharacterized protein n=1 Tax=Streptomyces luteosporeus TaxID=173856 RepID=A0ABP6GL23_9ACTN
MKLAGDGRVTDADPGGSGRQTAVVLMRVHSKVGEVVYARRPVAVARLPERRHTPPREGGHAARCTSGHCL